MANSRRAGNRGHGGASASSTTTTTTGAGTTSSTATPIPPHTGAASPDAAGSGSFGKWGWVVLLAGPIAGIMMLLWGIVSLGSGGFWLVLLGALVIWLIFKYAGQLTTVADNPVLKALKPYKSWVIKIGLVLGAIFWFYGSGGITQLVNNPGEFAKDRSAEITSFVTGKTNPRDPNRSVLAPDEQDAWFNPWLLATQPDPKCAEAVDYQGYTSCVNANGVPNVWVNPAAGNLEKAIYWRDPHGRNASAVRICEKHLTMDVYNRTALQHGQYPNGQPIVYWGRPKAEGRDLGFEAIVCNTNSPVGHLVLGVPEAFQAFWDIREAKKTGTCMTEKGQSYVRWNGESCTVLKPNQELTIKVHNTRCINVGGRDPSQSSFSYRVNVGSDTDPKWENYAGQTRFAAVTVTNHDAAPKPVFWRLPRKGNCGL